MKKVYASHEIAYQNIKKHGAISWNERYSTDEGEEPDHIGIERQRFIEGIQKKDWFPKSGKVLEVGCGTGHFIKWLTTIGFTGTGIDISSTAIEMAKEQWEGENIEFFNDDYCYSDILEDNSFDLIADGHCFHCIVEDNDRKLFLEKSRNLLKKDGVFLLLTSCIPLNKKNFSKKYKKNKFINNILYVPYDVELEGSKIFDGKRFMSQRKFEHWKDILKSVKNSGFEIKYFCYEQVDVFSRIYIAATIK